MMRTFTCSGTRPCSLSSEVTRDTGFSTQPAGTELTSTVVFLADKGHDMTGDVLPTTQGHVTPFGVLDSTMLNILNRLQRGQSSAKGAIVCKRGNRL
ncbi:hypothetical protein ACOMHN_032342 [Nucella lapillus]